VEEMASWKESPNPLKPIGLKEGKMMSKEDFICDVDIEMAFKENCAIDVLRKEREECLIKFTCLSEEWQKISADIPVIKDNLNALIRSLDILHEEHKNCERGEGE
jgi:hypothetical protein